MHNEVIFTKKELIEKLREIKDSGWIANSNPYGSRKGDGMAGNILEDLLGVPENNLKTADTGEWELKTQREDTSSLISLFSSEPEPRKSKIVPNILLPYYSWEQKRREGIKSFRATLSGNAYSNRGFKVIVDKSAKKILISFNSSKVSSEHNKWLKDIERAVGLGEISPQPYWEFKTIEKKLKEKIKNLVYITFQRRKKEGVYEFYFNKALFLSNPDINKFINGIEKGFIYIDFNARTGHNHGTRFRIRQNKLKEIYKNQEEIS